MAKQLNVTHIEETSEIRIWASLAPEEVKHRQYVRGLTVEGALELIEELVQAIESVQEKST